MEKITYFGKGKFYLYFILSLTRIRFTITTVDKKGMIKKIIVFLDVGVGQLAGYFDRSGFWFYFDLFRKYTGRSMRGFTIVLKK